MGGQQLITDEELTLLRADVEEYSLPDMIVIYTPTSTPDGAGGWSETLDDSGPVPARLAPLTGGVGGGTAEEVIAARIGTQVPWMLTVAVDTVIGPLDQVVYNGEKELHIALELGPRSYELLRRIIVTEAT